MSMNSHVIGMVPPDNKWRRMKAVWDACTDAHIDIPEEVIEFFNFECPDDSGVTIEIEDTDFVSKYNADMKDGFDVDIKGLLETYPHIQKIRFYNSY